MKTFLQILVIFLFSILMFSSVLYSQSYVGSNTCIGCHQNFHPDIVNEYEKSGHPYKLNAVDGAPPEYPEGTSPGVPDTPPNTVWNDFSYVIGGYGWKARFVKKDGRIFTAGDSAQYNLETGGWVAYHKDEDKKYNYGCFQCHTTGASEDGSWNGVPEDSLGTFNEPGIRCEGCHGPGSEHAANTSTKPPIQGDDLAINRCGDCHQRGGTTNAIPASGNYIRHHEQLNEMRASKHGDGNGTDYTCTTCHNPHVTIKYPEVVGEGMAGIIKECQSCHLNKEILVDGTPKSIDCTSCHMPRASKSAVGTQRGNGWRGDVKTHIMAINTDPVTREAMFTEDGALVKLDENGLAAVTMDFACLNCHTTEDVAWASSYAKGIHENGISTDIRTTFEVPAEFALNQNYPNPFNPSTTITFALPKASFVKLNIYSITGQLVETLIDNRMPSGNHTLEFNGQNLASGVYLYTIEAEGFTSTRKMTLLK